MTYILAISAVGSPQSVLTSGKLFLRPPPPRTLPEQGVPGNSPDRLHQQFAYTDIVHAGCLIFDALPCKGAKGLGA